MRLRDYQSESVAFLVPRKRAFIVAPAGSGKTVIGAHAMSRVAWRGCKVGWLANTREQVEQAIAAISRTEGPEDVDFLVACAAAQPDLSDRDIVVIDEAHHMPAETWAATIGRVRPDAYLWGLSATPWHEDDERNQKVRDAFKDFFTIGRERVVASGHLMEGKVYVHDLDYPGQYDREIESRTMFEVTRRCRAFPRIPRFEHERRAKWQITQEFVQQNENRNAAAVAIANQEARAGESVLLLVYSIEHGEALAARIEGAVVVHSKLSKKKRAQAIEDFRAGRLRVLVATSLADEGLDVPRASRLVLVAGGRSAGKLEQRAGRVLRPHDGKNGGVIHDFLDAGAAFAHAQAKARFRIYDKLGYAPEIVRPQQAAA